MFTPRITWPDLPDAVRAEVESTMRSRVVEWIGQVGGFSPGTADRLLFGDGRRVFCKAVSASLNEGALELMRRELAVNRLLPEGLPSPRMLHGAELAVDDDPWVVLLFDDVTGRHPHTPWHLDELAAALEATATLARVAPAASSALPDVDELFGPDLSHWDDVIADPPSTLDPWLAERLDDLAARGRRARSSLAGEHLCHLDTRADNMIVDPSNRVWLVDWPYACRGAAWVDTVLFSATAAIAGGWSSEHQRLVEDASAAVGCDADLLTDVWAGFLGYYVWVSDRPAPANLPTIRAFQAHCRDRLLDLLKARWRD